MKKIAILILQHPLQSIMVFGCGRQVWILAKLTGRHIRFPQKSHSTTSGQESQLRLIPLHIASSPLKVRRISKERKQITRFECHIFYKQKSFLLQGFRIRSFLASCFAYLAEALSFPFGVEFTTRLYPGWRAVLRSSPSRLSWYFWFLRCYKLY